ncbi:hypothetical protein Tco_0844110 [Tanacetum coccineum]
MNLVEIVKFCDDILERVLKEVKLKIFEIEFLKKAPLLGELDFDIMKAYEREITKRPRHREQMRRWESFALNSLDEDENELHAPNQRVPPVAKEVNDGLANLEEDEVDDYDGYEA